jgi:hypothetical protein
MKRHSRRRSDAGLSAVENLVYVVVAAVALSAIVLYGHSVAHLFTGVTACFDGSTCALVTAPTTH